MILNPLQPHPNTPCPAVRSIRAGVRARPHGGLEIAFNLHAALEHLRIPAPQPPRRSDGLWRHTCAEVFIRHASARSYREFNFSPSGQWQAYDFAQYREGQREAAIEAALTAWSVTADSLSLELNLLPAQLPVPPWQLNLGMVIETRNGQLSYWALAHPVAHPDFHHPHAFVLELDAGAP